MSDDDKSANDQTLLSLPEAARITFPDCRVKASGLRRERDKGRLRTYMVANKEYTTLNDLRVMLDRCVTPAQPAGPPIPARKTETEMVRECEVARDACLASLKRLKQSVNRS
jgi:hypothetical protein